MRTALLAALALAAAPVATGEVALRGSESLHQVLVFDAGSSGTRIHVFNVISSANADRQHVPRIDLGVRSKQTLKVKPGLSSFAERSDLEGTEKNIRELLDFANQFVDEAKRPVTPVLLKATAGLRAVTPEQAAAVLGRVRATLDGSGYRSRPEWADIIQGKEEGGLAWVAANFLQGTFNSVGTEAPARSLGVIEMGGGSTQVTFEIEQGEEVAGIDEFMFETALGKKFRLYAHSYLGYGQDHARARLKTLNAGVSRDPCYPHGYRRVDSSPVDGDGDAVQCEVQIETRLIGASDDAPGRYEHELPLKGGEYIATENFFYVQADLALGLEGTLLNSRTLESVAEKDCAKTVKGQDHSADTCFALSYQASLLKVLKTEERGASVKIARTINGGDVDWALGAALLHYLQGHTAIPPAETSLFTEMVAGALALLLTGFIVVQVFGRSFARQKFLAANVKASKIGISTGPKE